MKWSALALASWFTLAATSAHAQQPPQPQEQMMIMPVTTLCKPTPEAHEWLLQQGERPFASSDVVVASYLLDEYIAVRMVIWVNPKTYGSTVTFIVEEDNITCVIAMGDNFGPVIVERGTNL
jgi:hypothetical protein